MYLRLHYHWFFRETSFKTFNSKTLKEIKDYQLKIPITFSFSSTHTIYITENICEYYRIYGSKVNHSYRFESSIFSEARWKLSLSTIRMVDCNHTQLVFLISDPLNRYFSYTLNCKNYTDQMKMYTHR